MKRVLFISLIVLISNCLKSQSTNFEWADRFGGTLSDYSYSVAVDNNGNVYTTGFFQGTSDFDPGTGTYNLVSAGNSDIYISKVDSSGNFVWTKQIGGAASDYGFAIALDNDDNVYVTGYFKGQADFDPGVNTFNMTPSGSFDVFIVKLDKDGNFIWAKKFDGATDELCYSICIDNLGYIYTTGYFNGATDFDPGSGTSNLTPVGSIDIFVSKLDTAGNFIWVKQLGGSDYDVARFVTIDNSHNVYVTGYFNGTADFDPGTNTSNLTSAGIDDIFVAKLNSQGDFIWAKQFGGNKSDYGLGLVVDEFKNVYHTGYFTGSADFDPSANTQILTAAGLDDIFISKLDSLGNSVWVKQIGSTSYDEAKYITMDNSSNLYITGSFNATVDFDPGANTSALTSAGGDDVFVCKFNTSGDFIWANRMGGASNDYAYSVKVDLSNKIYTTGFFQGTGDFNAGAGTSNLVSAGSTDAYVHKMNQDISTSIINSEANFSMVLFPNPSNNEINLLFEKQIVNATINLINSVGQVVYQKSNLTSDNFSIDVSSFPVGVYFLDVKSSNQMFRTKFIKN